MNNLCIIFCFIVYSTSAHSFFNHDRAISASQNGDWKKAARLLTDVVSKEHDNSTALYDAGVAAFKTEQFDQALAYFDQVVSKESSSILKEQALFNKGNTYVKQQKLQEAITAYQEVLALNPHNQRAKHNLEIVKKMLEEQKQQQEQEKNQQQDHKQEQQEDKDQDNQKNNQSDKQSTQKNQGDQSRDSQDNDQQENKNNDHNDTQQGQSNKQDEPTQEKNDPSKNPAAGQSDASTQQQEAQAAQDNLKKDEQMEAWLAQLLKEGEQKDAQANKKIIKASVGNQLAGKDGQNCW